MRAPSACPECAPRVRAQGCVPRVCAYTFFVRSVFATRPRSFGVFFVPLCLLHGFPWGGEDFEIRSFQNRVVLGQGILRFQPVDTTRSEPNATFFLNIGSPNFRVFANSRSPKREVPGATLLVVNLRRPPGRAVENVHISVRDPHILGESGIYVFFSK